MTQPVHIQPEIFERLPFTVEAIRLTPENLTAVAEWCGGQVRTSGKRGIQKYIKVDVKRALNDRQTMAYVGDWVLRAGSGFKVYTPKAFDASFKKQVADMVEVVGKMIEREKNEDKLETELDTPVEPGQYSEGGPQPTISV
jgi:hypothetical protein